ncbi:MAG: DegT/DnrJ/EryC1/StrS family aminotransferase, partial [Fimbriimonadaceae bacterium]|nr:DegT/DnrJ/EryC1/StrS family aminotransferase [Fimbriimonadaceae bacterium]
ERRDGGCFDRESGKRLAAIMPVHILGGAVDLDRFLEIGRTWDVPIVEDAAEALGTRYHGRPIGSHGSFAACFSFNGNKILTTGGGGCLVTDDPEVARRAKHLTTQAKDDPLEYIHSETGYNYRMVNLLAAVGCAQLEMLGEYVGIKREIGRAYREAFADLPGVTPMPQPAGREGTEWLFTVLIEPEVFGMDAKTMVGELQKRKIQARRLWEPMHLSRAQEGSEFYGSGVSEWLYARAISLPCSVGLSAADRQRVIDSVSALQSS